MRYVVFLIINFSGLALGGIFTGKGVPSEWYVSLNKAPWTPPGWVFGFSWTFIMIALLIYAGILWRKLESKSGFIALFSVQWMLNFLWNPVFFYFHWVFLGIIILVLLLTVLLILFFKYREQTKFTKWLLLPYIIWLGVAMTLNIYIQLYN